MPRRSPPLVTERSSVGPDVDLDRDKIRLPDGSRLTQAVADAIVVQVRQAAGRPSLSGARKASPQIAFRVAPSVRERAAQLAAREGKTISQLAREALEARVEASH